MKIKRWKKEEDNYIKNNFKKVSDEEMAKELGRSSAAVSVRRSYLGLSRRAKHDWSDEEDEFIIKNYESMTDAEIGNELGRSTSSVRSRRNNVLHLGKRWRGGAKGIKKGIKRDTNIKKVKALKEEKKRLIAEMNKINALQHKALCDCKECKKSIKLIRKISKINNDVRRARGVPRGGVHW